MKVLSIRQPWAWAIVSGFKNVENRTWGTAYRGRLLIHASKHEEHDDVDWVMKQVGVRLGIAPFEVMAHYLQRRHLGAIVGEAQLVSVVGRMDSPWFFGPYGLVLNDIIRYRPVPMRGHLGLFNPPDWFDENLLQGD
jgi:hypothetical protein